MTMSKFILHDFLGLCGCGSMRQLATTCSRVGEVHIDLGGSGAGQPGLITAEDCSVQTIRRNIGIFGG